MALRLWRTGSSTGIGLLCPAGSAKNGYDGAEATNQCRMCELA